MAGAPAVHPTTDHYDDVAMTTTTVRDGAVPVIVWRPTGDTLSGGRRPAVVIAAEAYGPNEFTARVAATLAHLGHVVLVPDYYRGDGPLRKDDYQDFTEVMEHIGRLDFVRATHDVMATVELARGSADVDPARVVIWGYCTGATLALFTACLDRDLAAGVLFFPSQPTFEELGPGRPVHAIDLLWNAACPLLFIYGDQDSIMPAEGLADLRRRLEQWGVAHTVNVYAGAGHAFSAPDPPLRNDAADHASWQDAIVFLRAHVGDPAGGPVD